jgi:EAL domain-containing protein (putative c-di-GMP-specific phosphodiesterase class I)
MLEECLEGDMLRLAVQPIVTAGDSLPVAYEALLRSDHACLTTPIAVLRAAESMGMLSSIGAVVTRCADAWMDALPYPTKLFMNLHPAEFADPRSLRQRLTPLRAQADRLVIEITERARIVEIDGWQESVDWLRENGFALALDDLGAGYSSLSMLAELSPQYVKVDMSIVRNINGDSRKQRLVDLLCRFVETTDARVIAEGVETPDEAEALRACGVHLLQGYLFGRPAFDLGPHIGPPSESRAFGAPKSS